MVNRLSHRWLSLYLGAGLGCDGPVLAAVCESPSFRPGSVTEIWMNLSLGDPERYPSLELAERTFRQYGWKCETSAERGLICSCNSGYLEILKTVKRHWTRYELKYNPSHLQFHLTWKIPQKREKPIAFSCKGWDYDERFLPRSTFNLNAQQGGQTLWKTALDCEEIAARISLIR